MTARECFISAESLRVLPLLGCGNIQFLMKTSVLVRSGTETADTVTSGVESGSLVGTAQVVCGGTFWLLKGGCEGIKSELVLRDEAERFGEKMLKMAGNC